MNPLLAKRAGVSMALIGEWQSIVGDDLGAQSLPLKVKWPRRIADSDEFQPGVLVVAVEGAGALHLQHQADQVVERVNSFMGYRAIARLKLVQKPVAGVKPKKRPRALSERNKREVRKLADTVEDDALKQSLLRFGENVMRDKKGR